MIIDSEKVTTFNIFQSGSNFNDIEFLSRFFSISDILLRPLYLDVPKPKHTPRGLTIIDSYILSST